MTDFNTALAGPTSAISVEELLEKDAVGRLCRTYALAVDLKDRALCRSVFREDALGYIGGEKFELDAYMDASYGNGASYASTQHLIAQQYVVLDGDTAEAWSYCIITHRAGPDEGRNDLVLGLQYRDVCQKSEKGWQITERRTAVQWVR